LAGQIEKIVTLAIVNPDCTVKLFLTKKQLSPSQFGSKLQVNSFTTLYCRSSLAYYVEWLRKIEPQLFFLLYIWQIKSLVIKYYILAIDISFLQLNLR